MALDEMFVKINGERHYLWRAVDHEGEVLEGFVTKTRSRLEHCLIGMEACPTSHFWAPEIAALGQEVGLIPPA
jgi:transposase